MAEFYAKGFGLARRDLPSGEILLEGKQRRLLIGEGGEAAMPFVAFAFPEVEALDRYRSFLTAKGVNLAPSPTPLFEEGAFSVFDPDGRQIAFGQAIEPPASSQDDLDPLPGRLQHYAVATQQLGPMMDFYTNVLGYYVSDWMRDDKGNATAGFLRSNDEHHCLAMFNASYTALDHFAHDVTCWNDIRDWADHMASLDIPLWWGPGRHGIGNNLFFMVEDPDGNKVELSAELEQMPVDVEPREWPHGPKALNLWGEAWFRN